MYSTQVSLEHYDFLKYVDETRWCSYYKQIEEIINSGAKLVLLIGKGDGIVPNVISQICDEIEIITFDYSDELNPNICGDVRELSTYLGGVKYDAIVCCQVLEHLPYEEFTKVLSQISVCLKENGKVILSLPDSGVKVRCFLHIPGFSDIKFQGRIPKIWKKKYNFNGEHYWEVNSAWPYKAGTIRRAINNFFIIKNEYLVENNPNNRFYIASPVSK